jgi:hypothetical protein
MKSLALRLLLSALLPALLLLSMPAWGQNGSIKGQVIHKGAPLEFITIKLCDTKENVLKGTLSDELGHFEFKQLNPGSYSLIGEYEGFSLQVKVVVGIDAQVIVTMTPSIFRWIPQPQPKYLQEEILLTQAIGTPPSSRHRLAWS